MEYLWAPWRIEYIKQARKEDGGCILCDKPAANNDKENLILFRGRWNFVIMNAYPYNAGHLMVAPFAHKARLSLLAPEERHEHIDLMSLCLDILQGAMKPAGFNNGMNLGRTAGAGVDQHLHSHIVPRWDGDTNFMPVLANTRVVNQALAETYEMLKPLFEK
jgi:ATP adenylyltransferase